MLLQATALLAQENNSSFRTPGTVSLGTRNTFSMFNDDEATGKGIGGQFRIQATKRIGTEWFFDYITSKNGTLTYRNDYHIGWSLMFYTKDIDDAKTLQPYLLVGHCFDYSKVSEQQNRSNNVGRWSMAAQGGLGSHINITDRFDCSLSAQYMLHFGKEINAINDDGKIVIEKENFSSPDGHLLISVSFNYKLFHLW